MNASITAHLAMFGACAFWGLMSPLGKDAMTNGLDGVTMVSVYNYVQPIVSVLVSVMAGLGVLKPTHALAVLLVFFGVWLVTKSRKRGE